MRPSLIRIAVCLLGVSCTHDVYDGSYTGGPSTTATFGAGVMVGPDGAELSTPDGAFLILVPRNALAVPVSIAIVPAGTGGARTTSLYRVAVSPRAVLSRAVTITFDPRKAPNGSTPLGDGAGLALGSGPDPTTPPSTSALPVVGRPTPGELVYSGISFELERVFGLVDAPLRGRAAGVPPCVTACCGDGTNALAANGCGCTTVGAKELACLQDRCDRGALASGCTAP